MSSLVPSLALCQPPSHLWSSSFGAIRSHDDRLAQVVWRSATLILAYNDGTDFSAVVKAPNLEVCVRSVLFSFQRLNGEPGHLQEDLDACVLPMVR
jgi:hypothetical protein